MKKKREGGSHADFKQIYDSHTYADLYGDI